MVKQQVTMDFAEHTHGDDKTTAVLTQLVEINNLIANHLGSGIDPKDKTTKPKKKKSEKVDVVRMAQARPVEQKISKAIHRIPTRDFTGDSISKDEMEDVVNENMEEVNMEENMEYSNTEKLLPALAGLAGAAAVAEVGEDLTEEKKAMANPMNTSEGKALLSILQEAANKLQKYLSTARIDGSQALQPNDMRSNRPTGPNL
tara:strand:+ start:180 stop:785 length:606 start_codon:yes stop_codon:yes gene_type:complete